MRYANRHPSGGGRSGGPSHRTGERNNQKARLAEGVGFEPTVGFPTLDFESSVLNRTQPPFLEERKKRRTRLRQKRRRGKRRTPINREQASNLQYRMQLS